MKKLFLFLLGLFMVPFCVFAQGFNQQGFNNGTMSWLNPPTSLNWYDVNLITPLENNAKSYPGVKGDGSNDDTAGIQACLNAGFGTCWLPNGTYKITSSLTIPIAVELKLDTGAIIQPNANFNAIIFNNKSRFYGGTVDASSVSGYTSALLYFNGNLYIGSVQHVLLKGYGSNGSWVSTGIFLNSNIASTGIEYLNFHDIYLANFAYGIKLSAPSSSGNNWANGNIFNNIQMDGVNYGIYVDGDNTNNNEAWGNQFTNVQIQTYSNTVAAIWTNSMYNYFNYEAWDVSGSTLQFNLTSTSGKNILTSSLFQNGFFTDAGSSNTIIGTYLNGINVMNNKVMNFLDTTSGAPAQAYLDASNNFYLNNPGPHIYIESTGTSTVRIGDGGGAVVLAGGAGDTQVGGTMEVAGAITASNQSTHSTKVACYKTNGVLGYCSGSYSSGACTCN